MTPQILQYAQQATVLVMVENGHGSGFLADASGVIITARHVISQHETVEVRFHDGAKTNGKVLLSHVTLDYAFLKVPPRKVYLPLAGQKDAAVGQAVYAIGSPRDKKLAGSVTRGIVSAVNRVEGGVEYLQTDVAISGGNSGGPLVAENGSVVGMNVWGRSDASGINFALPSSYLVAPLKVILQQMAEAQSLIYCSECGFSNDSTNCFMLTTVSCCGRCGVVIGERG